MDAPLKIIRKNLFGIGQAEMAVITGVTQGTVSRWENGEFEPNREQMAAIRAAAAERKINWRDEWFFDASSIPQEGAAA